MCTYMSEYMCAGANRGQKLCQIPWSLITDVCESHDMDVLKRT